MNVKPKDLTVRHALPGTCEIRFGHPVEGAHWLLASQTLPVPREKAFTFFEDPRNLFGITPPWLAFRMKDPERAEVFENAEFDYTIRWLGFRMRWRSRIEDYVPPERFTDIQIVGPYRSWKHLHRLSAVSEGTLMEDEVSYRLPFYSAFIHPLIRSQLYDIFAYRAVRIEAWAREQTATRYKRPETF